MNPAAHPNGSQSCQSVTCGGGPTGQTAMAANVAKRGFLILASTGSREVRSNR
jgi:hypothetical protein